MGAVSAVSLGTAFDRGGTITGAPGDLAVDAVLVARAVGRERGERTSMVEQSADLGGVIDVAGAQRGRDDPPGVGI